ncbi:MAG: nuclease [Trichoglossum hirsutum]|jgi:endonuclease G|nr:MAG: nuclease [Trichoglossum hirsutum]
MSKTTLAIIAAVSAATGAAATAALYSSDRKRTSQEKSPTTVLSAPPQTPSEVLRAGKALLGGPVDPAGLFQYGFPGPVNDLANRTSLVSSFDRRLRNPTWVAEHITPESLALNNADRKNSTFVEDTAVPEKFRAKLKDYFRSGYDRGHQVPAADAKFSQEAMDGTFFLTNMCPQVGDGFNRDYWAHFEDFCRRLTKTYPSVRIVTGPLYLPRRDPADGKLRVSYEVIGDPPGIAVPTHFYKVIFAEDGKTGGSVSLGAFVLPNARIPNDKPLTDFEVPVEVIERASGLEFAEKLPLQRRKRLCAEVECSIVVRQFENRQKEALPSPKR